MQGLGRWGLTGMKNRLVRVGRQAGDLLVGAVATASFSKPGISLKRWPEWVAVQTGESFLHARCAGMSWPS